MYISDIDLLLKKLEIEFFEKPTSRILEEEKYKKIFLLRDSINTLDINREFKNASYLDKIIF